MSTAAPWIKFYPADWRADPALRACTPEARGVWLDLLTIMHDADPYGHLLMGGRQPTFDTLAGVFNINKRVMKRCCKELETHGVFSRTSDGVIYSRRMVRDHEKALADKANGRRGGNPRLKGGVNPPDKPEVKAQKPEARSQKNTLSNESVTRPRKRLASDETLPKSMTPAMMAYACDNGFVNGSAERLHGAWRDHHISKATPIADPEASFRTWVRNEPNFNRSTGHGTHRAVDQRNRVSQEDIFGELADELAKRGA